MIFKQRSAYLNHHPSLSASCALSKSCSEASSTTCCQRRRTRRQTSRKSGWSAKQGFWNGATPPLGYKVVEAERRGQRVKKKLDIDAVEAETIRLIFRLYQDGDGAAGPLGVKETTKWLNSHGYRTRRGATIGVGPVHKILTNACYASWQWPYGVRSSRDGKKHDPSTVIHIPVPVLVEQADFDRVQTKLTRSNPKTTPPRVVNGPLLLTGIAMCATCGSGMTRTGTTNRQGRSHSYYSCAGCQQKGMTVCKGRHIPARTLDEIVLTNLKQHVLAPGRITMLIENPLCRDSEPENRRDMPLVVNLDLITLAIPPHLSGAAISDWATFCARSRLFQTVEPRGQWRVDVVEGWA
jgi:site-specific DNA recombinase